MKQFVCFLGLFISSGPGSHSKNFVGMALEFCLCNGTFTCHKNYLVCFIVCPHVDAQQVPQCHLGTKLSTVTVCQYVHPTCDQARFKVPNSHNASTQKQVRLRASSINANEVANGVLSALVAITAGCPFVDYWGACLIGGEVFVSAWLTNLLIFSWWISDCCTGVPSWLLAGIQT